ncbi:MAG: glycosyltransferase [Candidatus Synoicihabitans palmerolidicus]|nr:glycosyltransferase [Candidatus Synoicihabitans palmerolidicus]
MPAFNEGPSLASLINEIADFAPSAGLNPFQILVVDDGSTDDTWAIIVAAAARQPDCVRGLRLRRNFWKSIALATGLAQCSTELVATLDADGQDDPSALSQLHLALGADLDWVSG